MVLYVVRGNTYCYGGICIEKIFGIYGERDSAESAKDLITKELMKKEMVDDTSNIEV